MRVDQRNNKTQRREPDLSKSSYLKLTVVSIIHSLVVIDVVVVIYPVLRNGQALKHGSQGLRKSSLTTRRVQNRFRRPLFKPKYLSKGEPSTMEMR